MNYARSAKTVDVHALKRTLWRGITAALPADGGPGELSFRQLLRSVPPDCPAGASGFFIPI